MRIDPARTINSVEEAITCLSDNELMKNLRPRLSAKRGDTDFGLWFRGHAKTSYELVPNIFRAAPNGIRRYVDEVSLVRHFKAMNPDANEGGASDFEWLVVMQHYLAPTRLLDWTENLLVALYFAVRDANLDDTEDAAVWLLNARRLNYHASATTRRTEVAFPADPDVIARSVLSRARDREEWLDTFRREIEQHRYDRANYRSKRLCDAIAKTRVRRSEIVAVTNRSLILTAFDGTQATKSKPINLYEREPYNSPDGLHARLRMPVAVYAARSNRRIRSQSGAFTLHGGKHVPNPEDYTKDKSYETAIGLPIDLLDVNAGLQNKQIIKWFLIPKAKRAAIRKTLSRIGVTDATLFPELDYQSKYLITRWTVDRGIDEDS